MFGLMKISTHEAAKDAKIADLKLANRTMANERDAAKTRASTAEAEIVTLKARIAELEKPVPLPKRKPVGKASPVKETVKVPVKGKSGKVTK